MASAYQTAVLALTPDAYWPMQDGGLIDGPVSLLADGTRKHTDVSGNGRYLRHSTSNTSFAGAPTNHVITTDGPMAGDMAVMQPTTPANDFMLANWAGVADTFTIIVWARATVLGAALNTSMLLYAAPLNGPELYLAYSAGVSKLTLAKVGVANIVQQTGAGFSVGSDYNWHMFACTKNGAVASKLYIDGVDVTGVVTDQTCVAAAPCIGAGNGAANSLNWRGSLAHAAVWASVLTPTNIANLFAAAPAFHREEIAQCGGGRSALVLPIGVRRNIIKGS